MEGCQTVEDPDIQFLRQMQSGSVGQAAWQEFITRISKWICRRYPSLRTVSDDLAVDAAVCVYEGLCSFRGDTYFMRWVYAISHNVVCKEFRRQGAEVVLSLDQVRNEMASEDPIARFTLYLAAHSALQILTDQERIVFRQRIENDSDHKEIARSLGITHNASRQAWRRASIKIDRYRRQNP